MVFENPDILWLILAIIPVLISLSLYGWKKMKEAIYLFQLDARKLKRKHIEKYFISGLLLTILIIIVALPKIAVNDLTTLEKNGEIILCVDVSTSMAAQANISTPNRLERAKFIINTVITDLEYLKNVKLSLCAFTNMARSIVPFVGREDYSYLNESIKKILNIYCIPGQNTSVAQAIIDIADKYSGESESKLLVIVSDGECYPYDSDGINWDERELTEVALQKALSKNINIITIGIGEKEGAKIPLYSNGYYTGEYSQSFGGDYVSYLHEEELIQYSDRTNGAYFYEDDLHGLIKFIDSCLITQNMETKGKTTHKSIVNWFIFCSFPLWIILVNRHVIN